MDGQTRRDVLKVAGVAGASALLSGGAARRYYWNYPEYRAAARLGGEAELRRLVHDGQRMGYRFMPMFGANTANRRLPSFAAFADAATSKIDDDRMDFDWVDWDGDRHQDGWAAYLNLGVASWRRWLTDRIAAEARRRAGPG